MSSALKKTYAAFTALLLSVSAPANADYYNDQSNPCCSPAPSCCDEPYYDRGPSSCCPTVCRPSQYSGPYCIPAPYCQEFHVTGEVLYWVSNLGGLEGAFGTTAIDVTVAPGLTTTTIVETDREPHWSWRPGYRVGVDYAWKCFVVEADWTHYIGRAHFNDGGQHGNWRINYNTLDLILGRRCNVAPCFFFKPFVGVRGAYIRQNLNSHLETFYTGTNGSNVVPTDQHDKERFWGVGPELGLEANWYLGCSWSLYASFDFVSYYGKVKTRIDHTDFLTGNTVIRDGTIKHAFNTIATDGSFGIRWDKAWCVASEVLLTFKLGIEQHRIYDFSELGSDGTLSLDGAHFAASIGYRY